MLLLEICGFKLQRLFFSEASARIESIDFGASRCKNMLTKRIYLNSKANKKYNTKMINKMITLDKVLEEAEHLEFDDREYLLNILSKRQVELRRVEISKRVKEALKAYKDGNVKSGKLEELWKDLND